MEQQKTISHFTAGLIISGFMVIYSLALQTMGMGQSQAMGWIAYLIFIVALVIFINLYAKSKNYYPTFGNLFTYGFKITSIVALVVLIFMIVFFLAFPEYKDKFLETTRQNLEEQDKMSDDKIDDALAMMDKSFLLIVAGGALFMYLVMGVIGSLIGAGVTKKIPHNPMDQPNV